MGLENIQDQSCDVTPDLFSSSVFKGNRTHLVTVMVLTAITHLTAYLSLFSNLDTSFPSLSVYGSRLWNADVVSHVDLLLELKLRDQ